MHFNAINLSIWVIFLFIVTVRYFKPVWVKNISYKKLFFIALGLNILYGIFLTWGQYYVWSMVSDVTRSLLMLPLPEQVPFSPVFEWTRPLFEGNHGYFMFYVFGRFWLNILVSLAVSAVLYFIFKFWKLYRGGFQEKGPLFILILMLISGFPGVLVTIALGLTFSIIFFIFSYYKGNKKINIEPIFILTTLISLFFTNIIFSSVL